MQLVKKFAKEYLLMIGVTVLMAGMLMLFAPSVRSVSAIASLLKQGIAPAVLGWGVLFNIKVGNWDFGVGAEVLIAAIVGGNLAKAFGFGIVGIVVCCTLVGLTAGAISGICYRLLRIPTIIISIAMMLIYESLCGIVFSGTGVSIDLSHVVLGSFPGNVILLIIAFVAAYFLFFKTKIGYYIKAVGNNMKVAEDNGINVIRTKATALAIAGMFSGLYASINIGSSGVTRTVSAMGTMGTCFNAMMCVFIGLSIAAKGNVLVSVYFGAVIMQMIQMALMVFSIPTQYSQIVIAVFVIIFMLISTNAEDIRENCRRHRQRKALRKA